MKEYIVYHKQIENYVDFTPHYISNKSPSYDKDSNEKYENCISHGKYCAPPRYDLGVSSGKLILIEDAFQKCIHSVSKSKYWDYMVKFYDDCIQSSLFNKDCSYSTARAVGLDKEEIKSCLKKSFKVDEYNEIMYDNTNSLLDNDYEAKEMYNIKSFPTFIANNKTINGAMKAQNLLEAVCSGLIKRPDTCDVFYAQENTEDSDFSIFQIFLIFVFIVGINVILVGYCYRYVMNRLNDRVENADVSGRINHVVNSYLQLRDTK
jgi:hypothetical protein